MKGKTIINHSIGQSSINYKVLEPYVIYQSAKIIKNYGRIPIKVLFDEFKKSDKVYSSLNKRNYKNLIKKNFHLDYSQNEYVSLIEEQVDAISFLNNVKIETEKLEFIDILLELEALNNLGFTKYDKVLLYKYIWHQYNKYHIDQNLLESYFFVTCCLTDELAALLDSVINSIPDSLNNQYINKYLLEKEVIDTFYLLGIEKIIDLKNVSPYLLIVLYNHKTNDLYYILNSLNSSFNEAILVFFNKIKWSFERDDYIIISGRNGWNGKKETLEDIGNKLSLTRERIRQKELKSSLILYNEANENKSLLNSFGYQLFNKYDSRILTTDTLMKEIKDDTRLFLTLIEKIEYNSINYSHEYDVLYVGDTKELDTVVEKNLRQIPLAFPENRIIDIINVFDDKMKTLIKRIILINYKQSGNFYIRKDFRISDVILLSMDKLFPTGYKISSDSNFNSLKRNIMEKYGDIGLVINKRQVAGLLENHKYRLVDRGTYLNPIYLPKLSANLVKDIIDFINNEGDLVHYDMIMYKFNEELNQLGVSNKYMLKGVLDPEINNLFYTKRDYITKHKGINSSAFINEYIASNDSEFSFDDLKNRFNGTKDYILYNVLYNRNDIIWLSNKRFINKKNLKISDEVVLGIYEECEKLFEQLKSNQISSKKIYARLSFTNNALLKTINVVKSHNDLFSLLQSLFADKYYFNRPIISKTKEKTNFYDMLKSYLSTKTEFNKEVVDGFSEKMNIRYLPSYIDFLEEMSEEYVQVSVDSMIRKDAFEINDEELSEIDGSLKLILTRMKLIDTKTFKGYYIFPQINKKWNKYLLIGILRTYFGDKYDIENTEKTYDVTDFLIRRRIDEK